MENGEWNLGGLMNAAANCTERYGATGFRRLKGLLEIGLALGALSLAVFYRQL